MIAMTCTRLPGVRRLAQLMQRRSKESTTGGSVGGECTSRQVARFSHASLAHKQNHRVFGGRLRLQHQALAPPATLALTPRRAMSTEGDLPLQGPMIIVGAPGGGKGTVCSLLEKDFKLSIVGTGDLIRDEIQSGSELGNAIAATVEAGDLVSDETVVDLLHQKLESLGDSIVMLDGFPRTLSQAEVLERRDPASLVIHIDVPFDEIVGRLSKRLFHPASGRTYSLDFNPPKNAGLDDETGEPLVRRPDDEPETVLNRLETYSAVTEPVLDFYRAKGLVHSFAGRETKKIYPFIHKFLSTILPRSSAQ